MYSYAQDEHLIAKMTPTPDVTGDDDNHYTAPPQISLDVSCPKLYHFKVIQIWWHSPFKKTDSQDTAQEILILWDLPGLQT